MDEARACATNKMIEEAKAMGSAIMQGASEVIAYGTAVKFR